MMIKGSEENGQNIWLQKLKRTKPERSTPRLKDFCQSIFATFKLLIQTKNLV